MATGYTGKIPPIKPDQSIGYIKNNQVYMNREYYDYVQKTYKNTRLGETALNGILSNTNFTETTTTVTLVTGSTLNIVGDLQVAGVDGVDGYGFAEGILTDSATYLDNLNQESLFMIDTFGD